MTKARDLANIGADTADLATDAEVALKAPISNPSFTGNVGVGTPNPATKLHTVGQQAIEAAGNVNRGNLIIGQHGSGFSKWSTIAGTHYNDASGSGNATGNAGVMLIGCHATSDVNRLYIGHGPYEVNPATEIRLGTYPYTTHGLGGTLAMLINSAGNVTINTETNYPSFRNSKFVSKASGTDIAGTFVCDGDSNTQAMNIIRHSGHGLYLECRQGAADGYQSGLIGSRSGEFYIGHSNAGVGFRSDINSMLPMNPSAPASLSDNSMSLGWNNQRYKDLHLAGSVHQYYTVIGNLSTSSAIHKQRENTTSYLFYITADNAWRTVLTNFRDTFGRFTISVSDAASGDVALYQFRTTTTSYGVSALNEVHYTNGGWNTGTLEVRYVAGEGASYDLQVRFSSYYSSSNTATGYLLMECM